MKKLSAIVLALICAMLMLTSCSSQQDNVGAKSEQTTNESFEENENAKVPEDDASLPAETQISMLDWGFSNPELWGCKLLEIISTEDDEHFFTDEGGEFVIIKHTRFWEFYPNNGQMTFYFYNNGILEGDDVYNYSVLNNDLISAYSSDEGNGMLRITERKTEDGKLIFGLSRSGDYETDCECISYDLIDTTRDPEFFAEGEEGYYYKYDYYKLYLK